MESQAALILQIAGVVIALATLGWGVWTWSHGEVGREISIIIEDQKGQPVPTATIVGPRGVKRSTDDHGVVSVPKSWVGLRLPIRASETGRSLGYAQISEDDPQTIILKLDSKE